MTALADARSTPTPTPTPASTAAPASTPPPESAPETATVVARGAGVSRPGPANATLLAFDALRGAADLGALWLAAPWLAGSARGDGHAVLVLPGLLADDGATWLLRAFLRERGWEPHGWGLGRNLGHREVVDTLLGRIAALRAASGRRVSLVGWSLGGIYARELARRRPDYVRRLVQLGTPFAGDVRSNPNWWLYELTSGRPAEEAVLDGAARPPPPVPTTSIWSRSDGHVLWRNCVEGPRPAGDGTSDGGADDRDAGHELEDVEVVAAHNGYVHHPHVLRILADRLARPERR